MTPCLTKLIDRVMCYEYAERLTTWRQKIVIRLNFFLSLSDLKAKFLKCLGSDWNNFNWFRKLYYSGISYQNLRLISCRVVEIWLETWNPFFYFGDSCIFCLSHKCALGIGIVNFRWERERKRNNVTFNRWWALLGKPYACSRNKQLSIRGRG